MIRSTLRRLLSMLLAVGLLSIGLLIAVPGMARAATVRPAGTSTLVSLTRAQVIARAMTWVDAKVPYSQSSYYPAGSPQTGAGHGYRQDCSGFVSMAYELSYSAVTTDFVDANSPFVAPLSSWSQLQPGDMLGISTHVVLFLGWASNDNGAHRYFDDISEPETGQTAQVQNDQDNQGYWKPYQPFAYRAIVATPVTTQTAPQSHETGIVGIARKTSGGIVAGIAPIPGWVSGASSSTHGTTSARTSTAIPASPVVGQTRGSAWNARHRPLSTTHTTHTSTAGASTPAVQRLRAEHGFATAHRG